MEEIAESDIKSLLNEVRLIKEKSDAVLDATGGRFNIFKILDVNQHENTHSKIIASFLNPNGKHGLKDLFLALFLCACFSDDELRDFEFNTKNAKVITESFAPADDKNGRIDILVKSGAKGIIIENKFLAGDQPSQLKRYDEWARKNLTAGYKILYLTKDGHKASEQSGNGVDYTPISYKEEIIDWLEDCFSKSAAFPLVRETLVQYLNLIKHYMGRSMSAMTQKEIISLLGSEENIKTVKLIAKNYDKVLKAKAAELFEEMDKIVTQNFGNKKFEKQVRSKAGDKDFLIRYIFSDIGDVNLCILFENSKEMDFLKCNLEYKKNLTEEEKLATQKKYSEKLSDLQNQIAGTKFSAWRMGFNSWETRKAEILENFNLLLKKIIPKAS